MREKLKLLIKLNKLNEIPRAYWRLRGVKNPETVAEHIFTLILMVWIFAKDGRSRLDLAKLLEMAICHELSAVYTGDTTPYDRILPKNKNGRKEILKRWPLLSEKEKRKIFQEDRKKEEKAIKEIVSGLDSSFGGQIMKLWKEYRDKSSPEGQFLSQLNVLAVLFRGLLCEKRDKHFSAAPIWEWFFQSSDDPMILKIGEEMKKEFCSPVKKKRKD